MIASKGNTGRIRRALCALMALALLLGLLPMAGVADEVIYGRVTKDKVLFRQKIGESDYWSRLDTGWVLKIEGTSTLDGSVWYKLSGNTPEHMTRNYTGYIKSDFFAPMTAAEQASWLASPLQPGESGAPVATESSQTSGYALVLSGGAQIRATADYAGASLGALPINAIVRVNAEGTQWHNITYGEITGYVLLTALKLLTVSEYNALTNPSVPTLPTSSAKTDSPTQGVLGYVLIIKENTNLRNDADGSSLLQISKNTQVPYVRYPVAKNGYDWLYVYYQDENTYGYVRSDCYSYVDGTPPPTQAPTQAPSVTPTPETAAGLGYVRITKDKTNLRNTPDGSSIGQVDKYRQLPYYAYPTEKNGYYWLYVYDDEGKVFGYVRSDCYAFVGSTPAPTAQPAPSAPTAAPAISGYVVLIKGGVNLRDVAGGDTIAQLSRGTILPYSAIASAEGHLWYRVSSEKHGVGYVRSDMTALCDASGKTVAPGATPAPTTPQTPIGDTVYGYIITTKSNVNLRSDAKSGTEVYEQLPKGKVYPIIGATVFGANYTWYYVRAESFAGFLRGDCVRQLTAAEVTEYLAGQTVEPGKPTDNPTPVVSYIKTIKSAVNLRKSASKDSTSLFNVDSGSVMPYSGTVTTSGQLWYKATWLTETVWVRGDCARVLTQAEYLAYVAGLPTATPVPTATPIPSLANMSKVALTTIANLLVRRTASVSGSSLVKIYTMGTKVAITGRSTTAGGYYWVEVTYSGSTGWVRGDYLRVLTVEEAKLLEQTGNPDAPKEASYSTLRKASSGTDVTRLQTRLAELGYLSASDISGTYLTSTVDAVTKYQRDKKLVVDGIAGANTLHSLYGTVPEGTNTLTNGSSVTVTLYPVEIVDWYATGSSSIQSVYARGKTAVVTDVKTGISFRARRWAGAYHADVEPLTAADTAAMCKIYGVKTAQAISDNNLYQRRAVWVTIDGRTFCASMYGIPHNYPDGDTIDDNEYSGQFCLHFLNSMTHGTKRVDADHMAAIQYAYDHAAARK